jgi:hypothetical protein
MALVDRNKIEIHGALVLVQVGPAAALPLATARDTSSPQPSRHGQVAKKQQDCEKFVNSAPAPRCAVSLAPCFANRPAPTLAG